MPLTTFTTREKSFLSDVRKQYNDVQSNWKNFVECDSHCPTFIEAKRTAIYTCISGFTSRWNTALV